MKTLPNSFTDDGKQFTLVDREGDVAILSYTMHGRPCGWEIVQIRKYADRNIAGNFCAAHEAMPPSSAWGDEGFTVALSSGIDIAYQKFLDMALVATPSQILGEPTGKPRGRARSDFDLDLSTFRGIEFEFAHIRDLYAAMPEPMLRNRLKTEVDNGAVLCVREITGGKGKPRKVYKLVD